MLQSLPKHSTIFALFAVVHSLSVYNSVVDGSAVQSLYFNEPVSVVIFIHSGSDSEQFLEYAVTSVECSMFAEHLSPDLE